ncbi:hypothetical protein N9V27_01725 [bacterium]|nr:hypothetical protein [bacterium]|tara:strand:+ start:494 stop:700 length:207 start_codon:yes stop_codon:yes gene_type:complete
MRETKRRTVVKALIYRFFIVLTVWLMLVVMGQETDEALGVSIISNIGWTIGYYYYDRIWLRIKWGMEE